MSKAPTSLPDPLLIAPSRDEWRAMTPDERERLLLKIRDALSLRRSLMSEGRPRRVRGLDAMVFSDAQIEVLEALEAKAEQARARIERALTGLRGGILAVLGARGIPCPDDVRARLSSCDDPATLRRWLIRATSAGSTAEVFEAAPEAH